MRQFDVLVWGFEEEPGKNAQPSTPPFTDDALGWFFGNDLNASLLKSEAEWIVFAHKSISIDRQFLNDLAECISSFPMVDAFAPRILSAKNHSFHSGYRLDAANGLSMLDENAEMRFVAAPHPLIAAFSRRIIQRTGRLDDSLALCVQIADYSLRMLHAGGKMFSVPYLVANTHGNVDDTLYGNRENIDDFTFAMFKSLGLSKNLRFLLRHPGSLQRLWKRRKDLEDKRNKAILLSKLDKKFLADLG